MAGSGVPQPLPAQAAQPPAVQYPQATMGADGSLVYAQNASPITQQNQTFAQQATQAGYQWDPVQGSYIRTPASAGGNVNAFNSAVSPAAATVNNNPSSLSGLLSAAGQTGGAGSSTGGTGGVGGAGAVGTPGVGTVSGGASVSGGTGGVSGGAGVSNIAPIDQTAANAATFGAAKDQASQTGRSSIDSMNGLMGAAGMLGGGAQAAGTLGAVEQAAQGSNDVTRSNAVNTAASNLDVAKTNQASQLTQRGQDISAQQAQAQLAMEQAQLNSQRQLALLQTALGFTTSATQGASSNTPTAAGQASLY